MDFLQNLFSIKQEDKDYSTIKTISLLGMKFQFKSLNEAKLINTLENLAKQNKTNNTFLNILLKPSQFPKANGKLRERQLKMFEVMKIVDKIAKENNLQYWLSEGSLLGAVRHGGFIPWDDDADICMLRDDYLKIIPLLKKYFENSDTKVREYYKCKNGRWNYQVCICNKESLNSWQTGGAKKDWSLDIFPFDKYYKSEIDDSEKDEITKKIKYATSLLQEKCTKDEKFAIDIEKVRKHIIELRDKIILNNNEQKNENMAIFTGIDFGFICPKRFLFSYDCIFPTSKIEFEGYEFSCPNNLDKYLTNAYGGDYMSLPSGMTYEQTQNCVNYLNFDDIKK